MLAALFALGRVLQQLRSPLLLLGFLNFLPVLDFPHHASVMPRQRGKSKRGSAWQPNRPRLALRPPPAPSHSSSPSSPTSSAQSGHSLNSLSPLSSPYACRIEWFDLLGNSLGFNPGPISDLASTSASSSHSSQFSCEFDT
jgi:hypothetical protein